MSTEKENLSRRGFLSGVAATAATAAFVGLTGCAPKSADAASNGTSSAGIPENWDYETEVLVVGAGGAGYMAALAAAEQGSSALVLEKLSSPMGDTAVCACGMFGPWPEQTKKDSGQDDTIEKYMTDWEKTAKWNTRYYTTKQEYQGERPLSQRQVELCPETYDWIAKNAGVEWKSSFVGAYDPQPKWETITPRNWTAVNRIVPPLADAAGKNNIETLFDTPATDLIVNEEGRVIGLRAQQKDGKIITAKAQKAVILASGSFLGDRFLTTTNYPDKLYAALGCTSGVTGDGHKMVMKIGGAMRDMDAGLRYGTVDRGGITQNVVGSWRFCGGELPQVPGIFLNLHGKRYAAETIGYSFAAYEIAQQPFGMAYYMVDSVGATATHFLEGHEDKSDLMYYEANSLEEMASKMNVDPATLIAEVDRYNGFVSSGVDSDFGKVMTGTTPLTTPPFYAIMEEPLPYHTFGGISTDVDSHVLDKKGNPISGLYAAGACCGSYAEEEGLLYTGGVAQALAFGRQAGKLAAAEKAWA